MLQHQNVNLKHFIPECIQITLSRSILLVNSDRCCQIELVFQLMGLYCMLTTFFFRNCWRGWRRVRGRIFACYRLFIEVGCEGGMNWVCLVDGQVDCLFLDWIAQVNGDWKSFGAGSSSWAGSLWSIWTIWDFTLSRIYCYDRYFVVTIWFINTVRTDVNVKLDRFELPKFSLGCGRSV